MRRCPITYQEIPEGMKYSADGLKRLSPRLTGLEDLPYSAEEQRRQSVTRSSKMSIQGVQPKLSARLDVAGEMFRLVDTGGSFILKPQTEHREVPENEDLTMRLAASASIEVPLHGLLYSKDGSLTYFIRRFDRVGGSGKLPVEDFAQLAGKTRDTKYDASMEQVAALIDRYATFPVIEKVKLFRRTVFSFLVGNEDMHLKNLSLIRREGKSELSPAYDLLNSTIAIGGAEEEIALPLKGRKRNLNRGLLVEYFGRERLGLNDPVLDEVLAGFTNPAASYEDEIDRSFLSAPMKRLYLDLYRSRLQRLMR